MEQLLPSAAEHNERLIAAQPTIRKQIRYQMRKALRRADRYSLTPAQIRELRRRLKEAQ